MTQLDRCKRILIAACAVAVAALGGQAAGAPANERAAAGNVGETTGTAAQGDMKGAERQIGEAAQVVRRMEGDADAAHLLEQARGVFVVTNYGRAALGAGGRGGEGVLMIRRNGQWQGPAFYTLGGGSVGAQAGVEGGSLVYVLNTDKAVKAFDRQDNWSLNAEAGLIVVVWSGEAQAQAPAGKGDVTVWSDNTALLASVGITATDIHFDAGKTDALYGKPVQLAEVFNRNAAPAGNAAVLQGALAAARNAPGNAGDKTAANIMRNASASAYPNPNARPGS